MSARMTVKATIPARASIDIEKMARQLPPETLATFRGPNPSAQFDRLIGSLQEDIEIELYNEAASRWDGAFEVVDHPAVVKALIASRILGPRTAIEEAAWAVGADLSNVERAEQPDLFGGDAA